MTLDESIDSLGATANKIADELIAARARNRQLLEALAVITRIGGKLDDSLLTTRTGPGDAARLGLLYCEARRIAHAAIASSEVQP